MVRTVARSDRSPALPRGRAARARTTLDSASRFKERLAECVVIGLCFSQHKSPRRPQPDPRLAAFYLGRLRGRSGPLVELTRELTNHFSESGWRVRPRTR